MDSKAAELLTKYAQMDHSALSPYRIEISLKSETQISNHIFK